MDGMKGIDPSPISGVACAYGRIEELCLQRQVMVAKPAGSNLLERKIPGKTIGAPLEP